MSLFFYQSLEYCDLLQHPFTHKSTPGHIRDIQDGEICKELSKPGEFLSFPEHTALILNADGAPIFKSAGNSIWPIYLCITSFPPEIRMNARNLLLAGVWCAPVKPDMKVILGPVLEAINQLKLDGIPIETATGQRIVKACLLLAVFDLPALAMACNTTQFNGNYGCLHCRPRTSRQQMEWAKEAERNGMAVYGVKGTSILSNSIAIPNQCPIDYMHAVLEGVMKKLMQNYWFNSKHHGKRFYLLKDVSEIDKRLQRIKPPHDFRSTPRPISNTFTFGKRQNIKHFCCIMPVLS